jgi:hypothetical protein
VSIKKKAKAKIKVTAKKRAVKSAPPKSVAKKKKGKDIVEVRENINALVKDSAELIATSVIGVATRTGQLASAKYLFEAIGLYPATEETAPTPATGSLAHTLLTRMGLPTEPVISDEEEPPVPLTLDVKVAIREGGRVGKEDSAKAQENEPETDAEKVEGKPTEGSGEDTVE